MRVAQLRPILVAVAVLVGTLVNSSPAAAYTVSGSGGPYSDWFAVNGGLLSTSYRNNLIAWYEWRSSVGLYKVTQMRGGGCINNGYQIEKAWAVTLKVVDVRHEVYDGSVRVEYHSPSTYDRNGLCQYVSDIAYNWWGNPYEAYVNVCAGRGFTGYHEMQVYSGSTWLSGNDYNSPWTSYMC